MTINSDPTGEMAAQNLQSEIGIRVAKKVLDATRAEGQAAVALIQSAAKVAQQAQSGHAGSLDVTG